MTEVAIHPLVVPWGRFSLYSFFIDAPEPAIVDTGVAESPELGMAGALAKLGRSIEDVRWILLTHGHIDHIGGAAALWEMTGRQAQIVIGAADADLLRSRRAHVDLYLEVRQQYLANPAAEQQQTVMAQEAISGEMEPTALLSGGERLDLGGGVTVSAHSVPGHTPGSMAYQIDGQDAVFVGDAVQIHGAANGFPGYSDPGAYRASLLRLRDDIRPRRLYLGHPYRDEGGQPFGVELDQEQSLTAVQQSIDIEARIAAAAEHYLHAGMHTSASPYSPFAPVADELGYDKDPTLEPSPFFTTMHGYAQHFDRAHSPEDS